MTNKTGAYRFPCYVAEENDWRIWSVEQVTYNERPQDKCLISDCGK